MKPDDIDPIPDDLAAILRDASNEAAPPAGAKASVWAKTMAQINAPIVPPVTAPAAASAVRTAAVGGFAAGLVAGIAGTWVAATMVFVAPVERVEVPVTPTVVAVLATPAPTATPVVVKTKEKPIALAIATPPEDSSSGERATERAWLDAARTALNRGDFDAAMQSLESARTRFPNGTLSEEREALALHVLIGRGDFESARLAVSTFRKRHEGSLFLPAIEEAMREMESRR